MLAGESDYYEVVDYWECVEPGSVQTPQEVFAQMIGEGIQYIRVHTNTM